MKRSKMRSRSSGTKRRRSDALDDLWALCVAALLLLVMAMPVCRARAQDLPPLPDVSSECAPDVAESAPRRAMLAHANGTPGVWFHLDVARCMLGRLSTLPLYADRVRLLSERLQLDDRRIALLREAVALSKAAEDRATAALETAYRAAREAEEAADAWYRSPVLWFALGAATTVAVALVGIAAAP